jgi:uncharacterized iron-regulated membrane protein
MDLRGPSALYRLIWRWHFYAGLFAAPILVLLAITGGLYLFEREIDRLLHHDAVAVMPGVVDTPLALQQKAVLAAYPGATIGRYAAPVAPDRAAEWGITTAAGEGMAVFVDPTNAKVTGAVPDSARLTSILSALHCEIMIGKSGDLIVELAASWGFVLLVSGMFLWWPRKTRVAGTVLPRVKARGRALIRDLHAVPALWIAPIIAFLILTGLPWSGFWGDNLARLGTVEALAPALSPTPNFSPAPDAPPHHPEIQAEAANHHPFADELPWAVRHAAMPSATHAAMPGGFDADALQALAAARGMDGAGLRIFFPQSAGDVFTASYIPDQAQSQRTLHVDPATGKILADIGWQQYSPLGKAVEFGVMVHLGRQFGLANQIVLAVICAGFVAIIGFGLYAWWLRRPARRLGAPPVTGGYRATWPVVAIAVVLGVLFPLVGLSMLVIAAIDLVIALVATDRGPMPESLP